MRRSFLVVVALSSLLLAAPATAADGDPKVTASRNALVGEFPGQIALLAAGVSNTFQAQFCGGTQISADWVMTAAHCVVDGAVIDKPDVLLGTTLLDGTGTRIATVQVVVHPQFDFPVNDIALLRLATPFAGPFARLSFPGHEVLEIPGVFGVVSGWGGLSADENNQMFPIDLQAGAAPVIGDDVCNARLAPYDDTLPPGSEPTIVCAGGGQSGATTVAGDACRGDSGGPLWAVGPDGKLRQLGIVSGGPTCGFSPTYYTLVPGFIGFIEATTGLTLASFPDIAGNLLEPDIERIAVRGITTGNAAGSYEPASQVTRGQMATFLARALGLAPVATGPFSDVTGGGTHDGNINAVAAAGIAGGFADGTFHPELPVNRAQMASFIARALRLAQLATGPFVDLAGFEAHAGNINAIAAAGIARVPADSLYRPGNPVSRAQMAAFLSRAFL